MVKKLVSFVLHVQHLSLKDQHQESDGIAMDETPVQTGTTNVTDKSLVVKNLALLCALLQKQIVENYLL